MFSGESSVIYVFVNQLGHLHLQVYLYLHGSVHASISRKRLLKVGDFKIWARIRSLCP